jgi:hypothetical protein
MARFRNMAEIPLILVGTQDAISETSPRMVDDVRARKLAADLKVDGEEAEGRGEVKRALKGPWAYGKG